MSPFISSSLSLPLKLSLWTFSQRLPAQCKRRGDKRLSSTHGTNSVACNEKSCQLSGTLCRHPGRKPRVMIGMEINPDF